MTIDEIVDALQGVVDGADGRDLTADEVTQYEDFEAQLLTAQKSEQVRARQGAYTAPAAVSAPLHVSPKVDDGYVKAFEAYMRTGKPNADLVNAQSEGTGSEGGYLVPDEFRRRIIERMKAFGGIAAEAETITTTTGANLPWVTNNDTSNLGEIVDEGGVFTSGADLVFGTDTLGAWSYAAGGGSSTPLRISYELAQDSAFDLAGFVDRKLGERIYRLQAGHLVTGTGVKQPLGLVTGLTGIEIAADGAGIVYDDLIHFTHAVDPAYRDMGNCKWAFNDASLETIKKLKDSHGDPIWRPADADMATATGGGVLLGYPVVIDQAFANFSAANNAVNWGAFGDFREGYVIRRVREVALLVNPYSRMNNRQIEYSAWARMDATQQNTAAYVALTGEA